MHSLVRRFIKTAIGFLGAGLLIGGWMLIRRELWREGPNPFVVSAHTHALFIGFVMMLICGVALWLFPRPEKADTRYRPVLIDAAYWLLTIGTASRVLGELVHAATNAAWIRWVVVTAGVMQIVAMVLFFYTMWSRIRAVGSQVREAKGERF